MFWSPDICNVLFILFSTTSLCMSHWSIKYWKLKTENYVLICIICITYTYIHGCKKGFTSINHHPSSQSSTERWFVGEKSGKEDSYKVFVSVNCYYLVSVPMGSQIRHLWPGWHSPNILACLNLNLTQGHPLVAKFSNMCHFRHFFRVSRKTWPKSTGLLWKI